MLELELDFCVLNGNYSSRSLCAFDVLKTKTPSSVERLHPDTLEKKPGETQTPYSVHGPDLLYLSSRWNLTEGQLQWHDVGSLLHSWAVPGVFQALCNYLLSLWHI